MNHDEARALLAEVAGGELSGERADAVRAHARRCEACGAALVELEATVALCRRAGQEPLPDGFALELHKRLVAAGPPPSSWLARVRAGLARRPFALAAAAAALAALVATGATTLALRGRGATEAFRVPSGKVALVKIDFVAERAVEEVTFEVTLPDGLRFFARGEEIPERSFRWSGKLVSGSNPIPIAVKGPRAGRYRVIAHAVGDQLDVTHEVVLEVTS
jgi:anti-sigma factor RsiW